MLHPAKTRQREVQAPRQTPKVSLWIYPIRCFPLPSWDRNAVSLAHLCWRPTMKTFLLPIAVFLFAARAEATLVDLHNGLVVDTINGIAWTQRGDLSPAEPWDEIQAW